MPSAISFSPRTGKRDRCYAPSYDWGAPTLGERHDRISDAVWHIPGWLMREDAMKLYELAWFSPGPILEIGTYCGRSAVVLATGVADSGRDLPVLCLDIDPLASIHAKRAAEAHHLDGRILVATASATQFLRVVPQLQPALVFVDGDHSEAGVRADLAALDGRVAPGGVLVFHDFLPFEVPDTTGFPVSPLPIEVERGVAQSWVAERAEFAGTFGCCGVFRLK